MADETDLETVHYGEALYIDLITRLLSLGWPFSDAKAYIDSAFERPESERTEVWKAVIRVSDLRSGRRANPPFPFGG